MIWDFVTCSQKHSEWWIYYFVPSRFTSDGFDFILIKSGVLPSPVFWLHKGGANSNWRIFVSFLDQSFSQKATRNKPGAVSSGAFGTVQIAGGGTAPVCYLFLLFLILILISCFDLGACSCIFCILACPQDCLIDLFSPLPSLFPQICLIYSFLTLWLDFVAPVGAILSRYTLCQK